jgi:hypothetical protein
MRELRTFKNGVLVSTETLPDLSARDQIAGLEMQITPRRLREAVLTAEGKAWLEDCEARIAALRSKIEP